MQWSGMQTCKTDMCILRKKEVAILEAGGRTLIENRGDGGVF